MSDSPVPDNPTLEDSVRRLVTHAERLHEAAELVKEWATGYLPGEIPAPLQQVIDAAESYERSFDEWTATTRGVAWREVDA